MFNVQLLWRFCIVNNLLRKNYLVKGTLRVPLGVSDDGQNYTTMTKKCCRASAPTLAL